MYIFGMSLPLFPSFQSSILLSQTGRLSYDHMGVIPNPSSFLPSSSLPPSSSATRTGRRDPVSSESHTLVGSSGIGSLGTSHMTSVPSHMTSNSTITQRDPGIRYILFPLLYLLEEGGANRNVGVRKLNTLTIVGQYTRAKCYFYSALLSNMYCRIHIPFNCGCDLLSLSLLSQSSLATPFPCFHSTPQTMGVADLTRRHGGRDAWAGSSSGAPNERVLPNGYRSTKSSDHTCMC